MQCITSSVLDDALFERGHRSVFVFELECGANVNVMHVQRKCDAGADQPVQAKLERSDDIEL